MDFDRLVEPSEQAIRVVEIAAAYILVGLFAVGVFDLLLSIFELVRTGTIFQGDAGIDAIIDIIDRALVLFIIVEIYQTVLAYSREESVVRIVIVAALIAVSRKIISFRPSDYATTTEAFVFAAAATVLLLGLVAALYVVRRTSDPGEDL
jgi:uncharacterized membrane protein (DUF373 family)